MANVLERDRRGWTTMDYCKQIFKGEIKLMFREFTSVVQYINEDGVFGILDVSLLLHSLSVTVMFLKNFLASTVLTLTAINVVDAKYGLVPVKTGINAQTGARPFRRNILDLQNDAPAWSLYIQALNAMQATPEDELLSYFQIAGIHGRPYYSWDGYEWNPDAPLIGYCTHHNTLFPTWHRPYLALFERILADHAQKVAESYNLPLYQNAADNLRIPYWDWAELPNLPDVVTTPNITITIPSGPTTVKNPLYEYAFQTFPLNETLFPGDKDARLSTYSRTVRQPDNDGVSQHGAANSDLGGRSLRKNTYDVFAKVSSYNTMATGATAGVSFEYPHGNVHTSIGGGSGFFDAGHMSSVAYSAYDPIFWLHHTNVDRLTSMWQAINPSSFLVPSLDETGTFTHPINLDLTVSEPLIPFTTPSGSPYTSTSSRYLADFGYAYPELQDWLLSPEELRKNVTAWVNTHYNPAPKTRKLRRQSAVRKEWSVAISALGTAFGLTEKYIVELSINGTKFGDVFVAPPAAAEAEGHSLNATTNFEVDLTDVLAKHRVNGEDVNAVTGFLKTGLGCSARQGDGTITSGEKVPGLKALVSEMAVTPAGDVTEFPGYGERREYPEILAEMGA